MLGAGALGRPRGMVWGGRREEGSGWVLKFVRNMLNLKKKKKKNKKKKKVMRDGTMSLQTPQH